MPTKEEYLKAKAIVEAYEKEEPLQEVPITEGLIKMAEAMELTIDGPCICHCCLHDTPNHAEWCAIWVDEDHHEDLLP